MREIGSIAIIFSILFVFACQPKTEYEQLKERELESGVVYDSLFAGLAFSMTQKEFFDYCWEMNNKGIFVNGTGSQVLYDVSDSFSRPTQLSFYPKYVNGQMLEMPVEFQYRDWALWNKETSVELLLDEIKSVLMTWYGGNDFIEMTSSDGKTTVWVKVDGNRQIRLGRLNISTAKLSITNLQVKNELDNNS